MARRRRASSVGPRSASAGGGGGAQGRWAWIPDDAATARPPPPPPQQAAPPPRGRSRGRRGSAAAAACGGASRRHEQEWSPWPPVRAGGAAGRHHHYPPPPRRSRSIGGAKGGSTGGRSYPPHHCAQARRHSLGPQHSSASLSAAYQQQQQQQQQQGPSLPPWDGRRSRGGSVGPPARTGAARTHSRGPPPRLWPQQQQQQQPTAAAGGATAPAAASAARLDARRYLSIRSAGGGGAFSAELQSRACAADGRLSLHEAQALLRSLPGALRDEGFGPPWAPGGGGGGGGSGSGHHNGNPPRRTLRTVGLCLEKHGLTDAVVDTLSDVAEELWASFGATVGKLSLFGNRITDQGVDALFDRVLLGGRNPPRELHFSNNLLTDAGVRRLVSFGLANYPLLGDAHRPLWLRVERNRAATHPAEAFVRAAFPHDLERISFIDRGGDGADGGGGVAAGALDRGGRVMCTFRQCHGRKCAIHMPSFRTELSRDNDPGRGLLPARLGMDLGGGGGGGGGLRPTTLPPPLRREDLEAAAPLQNPVDVVYETAKMVRAQLEDWSSDSDCDAGSGGGERAARRRALFLFLMRAETYLGERQFAGASKEAA